MHDFTLFFTLPSSLYNGKVLECTVVRRRIHSLVDEKLKLSAPLSVVLSVGCKRITSSNGVLLAFKSLSSNLTTKPDLTYRKSIVPVGLENETRYFFK